MKLNEKTELAMPLPFFETTPLPVQANVQTSFFDRREMRTRVRFILPSCCRAVSVRILHDFLRVRSRSISGSLLHWRISGGSKTFPEQSQTRVVVDSHRGLAAQRRFACRVLPSASIGRGNVRALAQRAHWRGGSTQAYGISDGIAPREASRRARKRTETTPAAAL